MTTVKHPRIPANRAPSAAGAGRRMSSGFTAIEMVMAIVLIGILAAASLPVIFSGVRTYQDTTVSLVTLSKLRYATERMAREIREIRRNTVTPSNYDISTWTAGTLAFVKRDGTTVTITAAAPNVTLGYSAPAVTSTLTDQVSSLTFNYYQIDGTTAATSIANMAFVQISLTLIQDGAPFTQRTRVALRNQT